jgi:hypothetical protein
MRRVRRYFLGTIALYHPLRRRSKDSVRSSSERTAFSFTAELIQEATEWKITENCLQEKGELYFNPMEITGSSEATKKELKFSLLKFYE